MAKVPKCELCGKRTTKGEEFDGLYVCQTCLPIAKRALEPKGEDQTAPFVETSSIQEQESSDYGHNDGTSSKMNSPMTTTGNRTSFADRVTGPKVTSGKKPTLEQEQILEAAKNVGKALIIEAGAGTGKTTTLRMLADVMKGRGQYTAFNTALVNETKPKFFGTKVACNTTHSLAFQAIGKEYSHRLGGARVRSEHVAKMLSIGALEVDYGEGKKRLAPGFLAAKVQDAIRRFCQSADSEILTSHFRYIDGIDLPQEDGGRAYNNNQKVRNYLLPFAKKAWEDLCDKQGHLPFSHDHYVKIWELNNPVISTDYIMIDEAQDLSPVMLSVLEQQSCAKILVGDSAQQIYEWRGAVNALASFPNAPRRFLSQSFRFGEAIAEVANVILELLQEPTQLRLKGLPSIPSSVGPVEEPRAILCRTNAVAVSNLLTAIALGKRPFLVGGGSDVISFVEGAKKLQHGEPTSHPDLACFVSWVEVQEYSKMDEGENLRLMVKLIDGFGAQTILDALKAIPMERDADLVISTAHKSKGREWDTVRLANDFPTKSKSNDPDLKLLYVAATRAKLQLDISECPFFTGEDALDIEQVIAAAPKPVEIQSLVPPTPSSPPDGAFTWATDKNSGRWCVRGPSGFEGKEVEVVRKDGSKCFKQLKAVVTNFGDVVLYGV